MVTGNHSVPQVIDGDLRSCCPERGKGGGRTLLELDDEVNSDSQVGAFNAAETCDREYGVSADGVLLEKEMEPNGLGLRRSSQQSTNRLGSTKLFQLSTKERAKRKGVCSGGRG